MPTGSPSSRVPRTPRLPLATVRTVSVPARSSSSSRGSRRHQGSTVKVCSVVTPRVFPRRAVSDQAGSPESSGSALDRRGGRDQAAGAVTVVVSVTVTVTVTVAASARCRSRCRSPGRRCRWPPGPSRWSVVRWSWCPSWCRVGGGRGRGRHRGVGQDVVDAVGHRLAGGVRGQGLDGLRGRVGGRVVTSPCVVSVDVSVVEVVATATTSSSVQSETGSHVASTGSVVASGSAVSVVGRRLSLGLGDRDVLDRDVGGGRLGASTVSVVSVVSCDRHARVVDAGVVRVVRRVVVRRAGRGGRRGRAVVACRGRWWWWWRCQRWRWPSRSRRVVPPVAAVVRTRGGGRQEHLVPGRSGRRQAQEHSEYAQEGECDDDAHRGRPAGTERSTSHGSPSGHRTTAARTRTARGRPDVPVPGCAPPGTAFRNKVTNDGAAGGRPKCGGRPSRIDAVARAHAATSALAQRKRAWHTGCNLCARPRRCVRAVDAAVRPARSGIPTPPATWPRG